MVTIHFESSDTAIENGNTATPHTLSAHFAQLTYGCLRVDEGETVAEYVPDLDAWVVPGVGTFSDVIVS